MLLVLVGTSRGDDEPALKQTAELPVSEIKAKSKADPPPISEAEQITRLTRSIAGDEKQLADLNADLNDPKSEYHAAEAEFKELDTQFLTEEKEIERRKSAGEEIGLKRLEDTHAETEKARKLARERFDLAIQTRKTSQEQVAALKEKLTRNRKALEGLVGPTSPPATTTASAPAAEAAATPNAPAAATTPAPAPPAQSPPAAPTPAAGGAAAASMGVPTSQASFIGSPTAGDKARQEADHEIAKAQEQADQKQHAAEEAVKAAQSITDRLKSLDDDIAMEQKQLSAARKKAEIAVEQREAHEREFQRIRDEGGLAEIQAARAKWDAAGQAVIDAQADVTASMERLHSLQGDRAELKQEEFAAVSAAKERQVESQRAQEKVATLKNPFALHNILQWLLDHGPRLSLMLVAMVILQMLIKVAMKRVVDMMLQRGFRGTYEESEDRAKTLVGVFQNAASTTVIGGGTLMMFEEAGIAVAPLMGGAAVIGLAVAFGAQNLIRDYFYGFVILLENQYKLNDVLKIGDVSGQVERITLRMTVLRDLEGSVHFIPNGKIECVTNMTHGWSRAVFEIKVAMTDDTDKVIDMLLEIAKGLRAEPQYGRMILEDAEMLGVDALADPWATIKFVIKTRPLKQWTVKREMLRRIRKRFTEAGIGMPVQQLVVHRGGEQMAQFMPASVVDTETPKAA